MKRIEIQMLDQTLDSKWWKQLIQLYVKEGEHFEIRCWNEEREQIIKAEHYGIISHEAGTNYETPIKGSITKQLLKDLLLSDEPKDKSIYNKMTEYFSIFVENKLSSEHYGTELYLFNVSEHELELFHKIMSPFQDKFNIHPSTLQFLG